MNNFLKILIVIFTVFSMSSFAQTIINDAFIEAGQTQTLTADTDYLMEGFVYVESGATLIIEPGTVIKAKAGDGVDATALIVSRGGRIIASGTPDRPIIFTSEQDDVNDPNDLPRDRSGLWGGVIILGNAPINFPGGTEQIEGIPVNETRATYGGEDPNDNSGIFRYVSIRHGGSVLGTADEINGLSLGGVGAGTVLEYVEVWANFDDGFEFFGGTVNAKYLVASFCKDDSFDWDYGYSGMGQFWFAIQDSTTGNHAGEHDGGDPDESTPYATPKILNATYLGSDDARNEANSRGFFFRDNTGGNYHNSIFADFPGVGIEIEDIPGDIDSRARLEAGDLNITNNLWWNIGGASETTIATIAPDGESDQQHTRDYLSNPDNNNYIQDPLFLGISREYRTGDGGLDPRVDPSSPVFELPRYEVQYDDEEPDYNEEEADFFQQAPYYGAFGQGALWVKGWTFLDECGVLSDGAVEPNTIQVFDSDINANEGRIDWTNDNTYVLNGFVFVEEGTQLHIEPGTVIKAQGGSGADASALIITRGAQIFAEGEANNPIIFTSVLDDVTRSDDLPFTRKGLWGGLIILGNAQINVPGGVEQIEGIPVNEPRGQYGGGETDFDNNDNSGILRFISIRHGGSNIGQNNEINGISLGGVGAGTVVEYCEVFANNDDGFEFFGGTVNTKYLVSSFNGDDSFDWDEGYNGKNQFWFSIQESDAGNNAGENDGGSPDEATPYSTPTVYNSTFIGSGDGIGREDSRGVYLRDNSGGFYRNALFLEIPGAGIEIEDISGDIDSRGRLESGDMEITNNIWWNIGSGSTKNTLEGIAPDAAYSQDFVRAYLPNNANVVADPELNSISRDQGSKGLDPRPAFAGPCFDEANYYTLTEDEEDEGFFDEANFVGAFGSNNLWVKGWTALDELDVLTDGESTEPNTVEVFDTDINAGDDVTWENDNEYILNGFVFVEEGATLRIEEGTVIKGKTGSGVNASALIIARGATIIANGTVDAPIIFTSVLDDVTVYDDLPVTRKGLWGGLIVLGNAVINIDGGTEQIEGIPVNEPRGNYGGSDDSDNSGVLRYISIRHGGSSIGQNNEINGLSLGGVGSGTTIEYIEVFANNDDGFEMFGGTAEIKYAVAALGGDDSFDYDEGWRGKGQFWFTIQEAGAESGNYAGEHDGGNPDEATPYAIPTIYNVTYIGAGADATNNSALFLIRDNAGGYYRNSIFADFPVGIEIEDIDGDIDSRGRLEAGDLALENNIWWNIGDNTANGLTDQDFVRDYLLQNDNIIADPNFGNISRINDGTLDPTPLTNAGDVYNHTLAAYPSGDNFFTQVDYNGAFSYNENWMEDWTLLDKVGYLVSEPSSVSLDQTTTQDVIAAYPNPAEVSTRIEFNITQNTNVKMVVTNVMGDAVLELENEFHAAGAYSTNWNVENVTPGVYFVQLQTDYGNYMTKIIVK